MSEPVVITLGCRLNAYESEVMRRNAADAGLDGAIIVNTCAVTGEAVRQATQTIRRLRREKPDAHIIVTGCAAQIEPERFAAMAEVDHVIGNTEKLQSQTFAGLSRRSIERVRVNDIMSVRETAQHLIDGLTSHTRAFVQIQNGCDHRCTFCIIPFGRGPSRSVGAGEIAAQIRRLVDNGISEVVLTGVDITSYGAGLPGGMTLGKLVKTVLKLTPELPRLRLSSIDQVEADDDLFDVITTEPRVMPHLHLSLQSGDDLILKRMKRRHSRADAIDFCARVRNARPDVVFGADLIAGFPTETEDMFQRSIDIVEECGLTYLHVFPYSRREGTPAARMPQVPSPTIKARAARLRTLGAARLSAYLDSEQGKDVELLMEKSGIGRTPQFTELKVTGPAVPPAGRLVTARVTGTCGTQLLGEVQA